MIWQAASEVGVGTGRGSENKVRRSIILGARLPHLQDGSIQSRPPARSLHGCQGVCHPAHSPQELALVCARPGQLPQPCPHAVSAAQTQGKHAVCLPTRDLCMEELASFCSPANTVCVCP